MTAVAGKTYAGDRTMDGIQVSVDGGTEPMYLTDHPLLAGSFLI